MLNIVVATDKNGLIGKNNCLPWYIPEELALFKQITLNKKLLMGRKTFESIPKKPLSKRKSFVLTRNKQYRFVHPDVKIIYNLDEFLLHHKDEEIFLIGGAKLIDKLFLQADIIYLSIVEGEYTGDVYLNNLAHKLKYFQLVSTKKFNKFTNYVYHKQ